MSSELSGTPFSFLFTAGPNGSLFVHSLFDGHPDVLAIPTFLNYYGFYQEHRQLPPDRLAHLLLHRTPVVSNLTQRKKTAKAGDFREIPLDNAVWERELVSRLRRDGSSPRAFVLAVHESYALAAGRDLSRIRRVLVHNHYLQPTAAILADFDGCGLIVSVRNPKGTIYSYYRTLTERFGGSLPSHLILRKLRNLVVGWELIRDVFEPAGPALLSVRLEDLHTQFERTEAEIAAALGVPARGLAATSTLGGQPYVLSTAANPSFAGVNPSVVDDKYRELGPGAERFMETFSSRVMRQWRYDFRSGADMGVAEMTRFRFPREEVFNPFADAARVASALGGRPLAGTRLRRLEPVLPAVAQKWVAATYRVPMRLNDGQWRTLFLPLKRSAIMKRARRFNAGIAAATGDLKA